MLTGTLRNQIDRIWDSFWAGGIANPMEVLEQITYLLFMRRLDDQQTLEENKALRLGRPIEQPVFPAGNDEKGRPFDDLRWSRFKGFEPRDMYAVVADHVFPFLRTLGVKGSSYDRGGGARRRALRQQQGAQGAAAAAGRRAQAGCGDLVAGRRVQAVRGLERSAAKALFSGLLLAGTASANQIEFINLVIDHLTEQGVMEASRLYESPFTDVSPAGPEAMFTGDQISHIVDVLRDVAAKAA